MGLIFTIYSCQDTQTKTDTKKTKIVNNKKAPKTTKANVEKTNNKTLITQQILISFLTDYGKNHPQTKVIIKTRLGNIHIQLYKHTPLHRANFIFLVNQGYFDTTCFHRVVADFIIQAGQSDHPITSKLRKKIGSYKIPPEFNKQYKHHRGVLSAARRWNNNPKKRSDAFEFFIVHKRKGLHHLNMEHSVFGYVTKGLNVVDEIAKETTDKGEWPLKDVFLTVELQ